VNRRGTGEAASRAEHVPDPLANAERQRSSAPTSLACARGPFGSAPAWPDRSAEPPRITAARRIARPSAGFRVPQSAPAGTGGFPHRGARVPSASAGPWRAQTPSYDKEISNLPETRPAGDAAKGPQAISPAFPRLATGQAAPLPLAERAAKDPRNRRISLRKGWRRSISSPARPPGFSSAATI
jgi:hypothetical protein